MQWENVALAFGYGLFYIDLLLQIHRPLATRSSRDVSARGVAIRLAAAILFFIKYLAVGDLPLIGGGIVYIALVTTYTMLAYRFRPTP